MKKSKMLNFAEHVAGVSVCSDNTKARIIDVCTFSAVGIILSFDFASA
jgi:hypothetical protein